MPPALKMFSTTSRDESGNLYKAFTIADNASSAAKFFANAGALDVIQVQNVRRIEVRREGRTIWFYNIFGKDSFGRLVVNIMQEEGRVISGRVWHGKPTANDEQQEE